MKKSKSKTSLGLDRSLGGETKISNNCLGEIDTPLFPLWTICPNCGRVHKT